MRLVAVVLSYNNERYLNECLLSIINQTRRPDLILLCDDCSVDDSVAIAGNVLSCSGLDFRVLRRPSNSGTLINLLSIASIILPDDVVVLCDADDVSFPSRFEIIFSRFSDPAVGGFGHASKVIDSDGQLVSEFYMQNQLTHFDGAIADDFAYELHGACLAVKGWFILNLPAPLHRELFQDVFFAFFASIYKIKFLIEPIELLFYRRHGGANSNCGVQMDYSSLLLGELKSRNNSLRLYNLHEWFDWYGEMSGLALDCGWVITSHFDRAKKMHLLKYNYETIGFIERLGVFTRSVLSKSPAWRWFFYRLFGLRCYYLLLSVRTVLRNGLGRFGFLVRRFF